MVKSNFLSRKNNWKIKAIQIVLVISLAISIILSNILPFTHPNLVYKKEFQKLGVYSSFPDADNLSAQLLTYREGGVIDPRFTEKEKQHMLDVNKVFHSMQILSFIFLVIIFLGVFYLFYRKDILTISRVFVRSGVLVLVFILLSFLFYKINFNLFFEMIHKPFFGDGTWVFDGGLLISLFPEMFFYDLIIMIISLIILSSVVFIAVGIGLKRVLLTKKQ